MLSTMRIPFFHYGLSGIFLVKKNKATISWKVCNPHIADINSNFCQELLHEPLPHHDMAL